MTDVRKPPKPTTGPGAPQAAPRAAAPAGRKGGYVLENQIGHILRRAHQKASAIFAANFASLQLTPTQLAALAKIGDEGQVSQNRLGRLTAMDPATMKGVIGRLHARGLIERGLDPGDRRRMLWRLTEQGEALLARGVEAGRQTTEDTLAPLSDAEKAQLLDLLRRIS